MKKMTMTPCLLALTISLVMLPAPVLAAETKDDAQQRAQHIEERFKLADKNHDGKMTRAEAEPTMPRIAKNFEKIDKDKKGYVTVDQVKAFALGTP